MLIISYAEPKTFWFVTAYGKNYSTFFFPRWRGKKKERTKGKKEGKKGKKCAARARVPVKFIKTTNSGNAAWFLKRSVFFQFWLVHAVNYLHLPDGTRWKCGGWCWSGGRRWKKREKRYTRKYFETSADHVRSRGRAHATSRLHEKTSKLFSIIQIRNPCRELYEGRFKFMQKSGNANLRSY